MLLQKIFFFQGAEFCIEWRINKNEAITILVDHYLALYTIHT